MRTPNLLVVPALLFSAVAFATPPDAPPPAEPVPLTETFADYVLLRTADGGYLVRSDDYAPARAASEAGGLTEPREVASYRISFDDAGEATSVLSATLTRRGSLFIYPKQDAGVPMAIRLEEGGTDISASVVERNNVNGPDSAGDMPRFRGGWDRRLRVRTPEGQPVFSSEQAAISRLPPALQLAAAALRESDAAAFAAMMLKAQDGQDVAPDLEHALHEYPPQAPAAVVMNEDRADVWASMHPVERAVVSRLPAGEQALFRQKIGAARTQAAAQALLGEIRTAASAYISSGGSPTAFQTLQAAMDRIARASIDANTGNVIFDGASQSAAVVAGVGQRAVGEPPRDPQSVVNAEPVKRSDLRTAPPPGAARSDGGEGGGLAGMLGGILRNPLFAMVVGAVIGAGVGFLIGGPVGAFYGGIAGLPGGLIAGNKLFGIRYGGDA